MVQQLAMAAHACKFPSAWGIRAAQRLQMTGAQHCLHEHPICRVTVPRAQNLS